MERGDLIDFVFSWSLDDIFNEELYKHKVERIPESFESVQHYLNSFVYPLLEETRAELSSKMEAISTAPFAEVISLHLHEFKTYKTLLYDVRFDWRNGSSCHGKEPHRAFTGDIVIFTDAKLESVSDLQQLDRKWSLGYITKISGDDEGTMLKVKVSTELEVKGGPQKLLFVVFLMNITTNQRIWAALHMSGHLDVIKEVLCTNSVVRGNCNLCPHERNASWAENLSLASYLDESQFEAVVASINKMRCNHKSFVELIWGPPGTGKTRTVSMLLWSLLRLKYRTLTCAPTNVAVTELASRVLKLVKESSDTGPASDATFCNFGDILLFGNMDRTASGIEEIHLDYRIKKLAECFGAVSGWKHCFTSMMEFLEHCVSKYQIFCDDVSEKEHKNKSFLEFVTDRFRSVALSLRRCVSVMCTHLPKSLIMEHNFWNMISLMGLLDSFETSLVQGNLVSEELKEIFSHQRVVEASHAFVDTSPLLYLRSDCLRVLKTLLRSLDEVSLPRETNKASLEEFCFRKASLIFCTASSSYRLHSVTIDPLQLLVIDEAAQLKECESIIPLRLQRIRHAVLIGDEWQLPAMINSKVSDETGFGRSLFERLSSLGYSKHLLNKQYRMHPSISLFPNSKWYQNRIMDAPKVKDESYKKRFLPGPMFGPYSFINISGGKEVFDDGKSRKNIVEVAVVLKIVQMLFRACDVEASKLKIGVMVVSPYSAQVAAIQQKLGQKYENHGSFSVKVRSIDGCQGGEEDIVIVSTVRSNRGGSIGFTSCPNRTNVSLTRARHCLWILGNEKTLTNSGSVWEELVLDAKVRQCFYDADEDKNLAKVILDVKKELDQLDDLLNADSALFRKTRWKVIFSDNFRKSFSKLKSVETKNLVLLLLSKLSCGWRPKRGNVGVTCESSSKILKQFMVGGLYIISSVDIVKESSYIQALKVWDIMPLQDIPKLVKRLENIFGMYTENYLNLCRTKCVEGDLEVPMSWLSSTDIVQYKSLSSIESGESSNDGDFDDKSYIENSKVRDSLLLMKFYSLSSGVVGSLLSGCDGKDLGLPFELTDREREVVLFNKSTFVLGRSGTGKTTVLTMKLFQNEQLYHIASEGFHEVRSNPSTRSRWIYEVNERDEESKGDVLHQLFVTVSPKLCYAVKQHVSQLKRSVCGGNSSSQSSSVRMDDIDNIAQFTDIPDSFVNLQPKIYPLIITFHKFLLMLDGTVGTSYFERFPDLRKLCHGKAGNSRSVALETFIRTKEVNFDRFSSSYWPHFNINLTRKLDSSRVFTEIMSVIKGGLRAGEAHDGKLCRQDYVLLSEDRGSTLSMQKREIIYNIFLEYEKKKVANGGFDLADLVIDLHHRFKDKKRYEGDEMDFVYIDEVQDLSMGQIALFKYICRNVDEGFAFAGDTAQTIARGIDFRFEDIRYLFYKEFVLGSRRDVTDRRKEKGLISRIFHLRQNFRTHDGVLKLAQSVINLLYHFFPLSIDVLSAETSFLSGEAPILLNPINNENVLKSIFENKGNAGGHVGFGAEQVILVRDECLRKEICDYVGKKALVLTIMDCKGLEFQDVLLYKFFSSSPFENQWRVIYEYMKEKDLLNSSSPMYFTSFNHEKHSVLCSELKYLYVAITRTKQRLWIYEDGFIGPMYDYWKKLCLVKVRQLDNSFIEEMHVTSSQEEWKSQGIKLFYENNYEMAMMCFERAGDTYWERLAEASGLRTAANCHANPETSRMYIKKAAEIYDSIGKAELAAQCFFEINEYERAGTIYMQNFGESKLEKAGECFSRAKRFKLAAEVYARAKLYSKSLSSCLDGKLFDLGLQYIQYWKQHKAPCADKVMEMDRLVQDFLQRGALHYYELKNNRTMMKFVKSFHSMESMRIFLKNLNCLDELLSLEREWGNFLEAADVAKLKGDSILEADLVEEAGLFREASMLILWYVFSYSMHSLRSKCRPLNKFMQKDELLTKAKFTARNQSDLFYKFVCMEAEILSKEKNIGEELEMGLEFIKHWKQNASMDLERVKKSCELDKIEQDLLERCARRYHGLKDNQTMMKYVASFHSIDLIRAFLKGLNCLDELLLLEEERGNYLEAADVAEQKGDLLRKCDLLEKAGHFEEASSLMLRYVLAESLWAPGSKGWPLKQFTQKEELLAKAISCAKNHSDLFYTFVCMEANVLSGRESSLSEMGQYLSTFDGLRSFRGEILTARRILDAHFNTLPPKYEWNDIPIKNISRHSEDMISKNLVSVETLVYFWNCWKQKILNLIDYLWSNGKQDVRDYSSYEEFCLNYFGVHKNYGNQDPAYIVLNSNAKWVREIDCNLLGRNGDLVTIGSRHFFSVALNYWCSELLSVGIQVLVTLKFLHVYSVESNFSLFRKSTYLISIFEIANFLQIYNFPNRKYSETRTVQKYLELSTKQFFCNIFHIDWRKALEEDMISLRGTKISMNLLEEAISENIILKNSPTYGQMGRVLMMILGSGKQIIDSYDKILRSFDGNFLWKELIGKLFGNMRSELTRGSETNNGSNGPSLVFSLSNVLKDTFYTDRRTERDYLSPTCFLYLLERLLILVSHFKGYLFTTRSSCVEWLIYEEWSVDTTAGYVNDMELPSAMGEIHNFMAIVVQELLFNKHETKEWIKNSNDNFEDFYSLLVLRLGLLLCLICVNSGNHFDELFKLLDRSEICSELPPAFLDALQRRQECYFIDALAVALGKIENPLVIVSLTENFSKCSYTDAIFLNVKMNKCREDILGELFPDKEEFAATCSDDQEKILKFPFPKIACVVDQNLNNQNRTEVYSGKNYGLFWEIFDTLESLENVKDESLVSFMAMTPIIKVEVDKIFNLLYVPIVCSLHMSPCHDVEDLPVEANSMLDELKHISFALDISQNELKDRIPTILEFSKKLRLRRPRLELFLDHLLLQDNENDEGDYGWHHSVHRSAMS